MGVLRCGSGVGSGCSRWKGCGGTHCRAGSPELVVAEQVCGYGRIREGTGVRLWWYNDLIDSELIEK